MKQKRENKGLNISARSFITALLILFALMLLPLILPVAQIFNLSSQLCVVAYAFGDGFSNVLYPTNPVLLISLGLAGVSYGSWFKWTWKFQAAILLCTSLLLLFGLAVGYA